MNQKIKQALELIQINDDCTWIVPNRSTLNMSIEEFVEFERARLAETGPHNPKYFNHYKNKDGQIVIEDIKSKRRK